MIMMHIQFHYLLHSVLNISQIPYQSDINCLGTEIADHAMELRRETEMITKERKEGHNLEDLEEKITISRYFKEKTVQPTLKRHFGRDEFLGRINEIVYFLPFSRLVQFVHLKLLKVLY